MADPRLSGSRGRPPISEYHTPGLYVRPPIIRCARCGRKVRIAGECLVCDVSHRALTPEDATYASWVMPDKETYHA